MRVAQRRDVGDEAVDLVVFVEEMPTRALQRTEGAAEHAFAQVAVVVAGAVEGLLGTVVNAGDAHGTEVQTQHCLEVSIAIVDPVATEAPLVVALAHLVVIVEQGDDVLAEPHVRGLVHQRRIAEQVEEVNRLAPALGQIVHAVGDVVDAQRRVEPGQFQRVVGVVTSAGDLADQEEVFLAQALGEFLDDRREVARGAGLHVFYGVDAEAVNVGEADPELVHIAQ